VYYGAMNETKVTTLAAASTAHEKAAHPLYASRPAAGFPAPGDDLVEKMLDLNDLVVDHPESTFFVRVAGESMTGAGILNGDVLVVDRSVVPKDGSIVVAAVFGELVVKYVSIKQNKTALVSAHEDYAPIDVSSHDDCFVWGVVVGSVRVFKK
jgi:DNA polymerase V